MIINTDIYKKIILSKIIIEVINNYRSNQYLEKELELKYAELKEIETFNKKIIDNNIHKFKDFGFDKDSILSEKLDTIYIQIIIVLIKQQKFENDNIENILKQLDLKNINLTENMYNILSQILNPNNHDIELYKITKVEDLKDSRTINFYYFLLSYILKNSIYIYENSFLKQIKKEIMNFKHEQFLYKLSDNETENTSNSPINNERIKYIINIFLDSKYYYDSYKNNLNKEKSLKNPMENIDYLNKDTNIKDDHMMLLSKTNTENKRKEEKRKSELYKEEVSYRILLESSFKFKVDENGKANFELNGEEIKDNKDNILKYKNLNYINLLDLNSINQPEKLEKKKQLYNSYMKFLKFFPDFEQSMKKNVKNYCNLEINLNFSIFDENQNSNLFNMYVIYIINKDNENINFKDTDILNYDSIEKADGFLFLVNDINEES